jgi:adenylate cyclase
LRVGIHLGDVVESAGDISGDAVNLASRIEALAENGGVCLTRQVYDHVQNKFELPLKSVGNKSLKNVASPVEVFRMVMPWTEEKQEAHAKLDKNRLAVLPLSNMSSSPEDGYFADGMTEELISSLSRLPGLGVISRTSVMQYKNQTKHVSEIGRELGAGTLLEGSVRKAGNRVRIALQLIDANTDNHLWAENYDRNLDDVFAIQPMWLRESPRHSKPEDSRVPSMQTRTIWKHTPSISGPCSSLTRAQSRP